MDFQVGDQVVHWTYGPGQVIRVDEKNVSGQAVSYYVVQVRDMTIWVPKSNSGESSLRFPTPANKFQEIFAILNGPGEPLSSDRFERKTQLLERMKGGQLASICQVIRDLATFKLSKKMNDSDIAIMERAQNFLLNEWILALSVPLKQAEHELKLILEKKSPTM